MVALRTSHAHIVHLRTLRSDLLTQLATDGTSDSVSIYLEDLNSGVNIGINEREPTFLASLIKVGVMIAWFKAEEQQPGILQRKVVMTPEMSALPNDHFARAQDSPLAPGEYTISSLIDTMILYSNNSANSALCYYISDSHLALVFDDLGVPNPFQVSNPATDPFKLGTKLTAKQYSNIIRALYNATYLNETHSARALRLLTQTKFQQGIRSVLPSGTISAMKYGVFHGAFYECGIVYMKDNPYLITIFTRGPANNRHRIQLSWIRKYAGIVHQYMSRLHAGASP
mgnify:CR=1 FL=1